MTESRWWVGRRAEHSWGWWLVTAVPIYALMGVLMGLLAEWDPFNGGGPEGNNGLGQGVFFGTAMFLFGIYEERRRRRKLRRVEPTETADRAAGS